MTNWQIDLTYEVIANKFSSHYASQWVGMLYAEFCTEVYTTVPWQQLREYVQAQCLGLQPSPMYFLRTDKAILC